MCLFLQSKSPFLVHEKRVFILFIMTQDLRNIFAKNTRIIYQVIPFYNQSKSANSRRPTWEKILAHWKGNSTLEHGHSPTVCTIPWWEVVAHCPRPWTWPSHGHLSFMVCKPWTHSGEGLLYNFFPSPCHVMPWLFKGKYVTFHTLIFHSLSFFSGIN